MKLLPRINKAFRLFFQFSQTTTKILVNIREGNLNDTHTLTLRLLTLFSTGGSLVLCILELVLCKLKVHEKHRRLCERADYDSSVWGRT